MIPCSPKIDPLFLRLLASHCAERGISVAAAFRELNAIHNVGISRLAALARRALRNQALIERQRQQLRKAILTAV
jgi:hypothetical protein